MPGTFHLVIRGSNGSGGTVHVHAHEGFSGKGEIACERLSRVDRSSEQVHDLSSNDYGCTAGRRHR
jgi:hypothetical protein